jgi:hypothetical protein
VRMRNVVLTVVGVAVACLSIAVLGKRRPTRSELTGEEIESLRSELADVKRQSLLNGGLLALGESTRLSRVPLAAPTDTPVATQPAAPQSSVDEEKEKAEAQASEAKIMDEASQRFRAEAIDAEWSATAPGVVRSAIASNIPAGSQLVNVECRSTSCRIEASHRDLDGFQKFVDTSFMSREKKLWSAGFLSAVTEQTGASVSSVTYYWREAK